MVASGACKPYSFCGVASNYSANQLEKVCMKNDVAMLKVTQPYVLQPDEQIRKFPYRTANIDNSEPSLIYLEESILHECELVMCEYRGSWFIYG